MRLLIIALLVYLLYKLWKSGENKSKEKFKEQNIGEMSQDPVCKIYLPVEQAYKREINGKEYFFCSKECADEFEKKLKEEKR